MRRNSLIKRLAALTVTGILCLSSAFGSWASDGSRGSLPFEVILDINNRKTPIYDGYTQYVDGHRASDEDTFHVSRNNNEVKLDDVVLDYRIITYDKEGTQVSQECTVYGLQEGVSYPVVRQETVERESRKGKLYDDLNRCYTLQFTYGDQSKTYYFIMVPEDDMDQYRNVLRGNWEQSVRGYRYKYQDDYLKSWGLINGQWYLFNDEGYMQKGWQQYKGAWYFLDRSSGQMRTNCTVDGYEIDGSGVGVD